MEYIEEYKNKLATNFYYKQTNANPLIKYIHKTPANNLNIRYTTHINPLN